MLPPYSNEDTSKDAAKAIASKAAALREQVYNYILAQGNNGATADEIEVALKMRGNTLHPRLWELEGKSANKKLVARIHMSQFKRPTRSGCLARVYMPGAAVA